MPTHRHRFIIARGVLRSIISCYLPRQSPALLVFDYNKYKKPQLSAAYHSTLQFNVSHSEDYALLAITPLHPIGIDVEKLKSHDLLAIAKRFFSYNEYQLLSQLRSNQIEPVFYALWTRKEAVLKAVGLGIAEYLSHVCLLSQKSTVEKLLFLNPVKLLAQNQWWSIDISPYLPLDRQTLYKAAIATNRDIKASDIISVPYML